MSIPNTPNLTTRDIIHFLYANRLNHNPKLDNDLIDAKVFVAVKQNGDERQIFSTTDTAVNLQVEEINMLRNLRNKKPVEFVSDNPCNLEHEFECIEIYQSISTIKDVLGNTHDKSMSYHEISFSEALALAIDEKIGIAIYSSDSVFILKPSRAKLFEEQIVIRPIDNIEDAIQYDVSELEAEHIDMIKSIAERHSWISSIEVIRKPINGKDVNLLKVNLLDNIDLSVRQDLIKEFANHITSIQDLPSVVIEFERPIRRGPDPSLYMWN